MVEVEVKHDSDDLQELQLFVNWVEVSLLGLHAQKQPQAGEGHVVAHSFLLHF